MTVPAGGAGADAAVGTGSAAGDAPAPPGTPHPDVARLAATFREADAPTYDVLGVTRARGACDNVVRIQGPRVPVAEIRELLVDGAAGRLPARLFHPAPGTTPPVVVYLHGGGFVMGGIRATDGPCRRLAAAGRCAVLAVDYRLAPETPFPGPLDDVVAALRWTAAHAADLDVDPERLVVMGDSAGGNLAAAATLALRAGGPPIARQVLLYPCLVPVAVSTSASMRELADAPLMTRRELAWFWDHYLRTPGDAADPRAVPPLATSHAGLPPATVVLAELDPLRDEGLAYAGRLEAAGVAVETTVYPGAAHGFWWMDGELAQAHELDAQLGAVLRALG